MLSDKQHLLVERILHFLEGSYAQIALSIVLVLTGYALLFSYFFNTYTRNTVDQRKSELRHLVELGLNAVQPVREQQRKGEISPEQARTIGRDLVQRMSFTDGSTTNYLFMGSYSGEALTLPYNPPREGSQWDQIDAAGMNVVDELIKTAQSPAGAGFVEYLYPQPNGSSPQKKISYVIGIPEWDSYIGTGMYMGNIEIENQTFLRNSLLLMGGLFLFVFFVVYVALRPALTNYNTMLRLFDRVTHNPDMPPIIPITQFRTGSEGWQLVSGFQEMLRRIRQSKDELRASEERFNLAITGATDGLWDWDIRWNRAYFSPRWKSMIGYAEDELPNTFEDWRSRIHPDDLERTMSALNKHLDGETPVYEIEHRLRHKNGSYVWILARGATVRDANGKPYRMAGSHTDITRRKRTEEALQRRDAILEAVSYAAQQFLAQSGAWEDSIVSVLHRLGEATNVDRIYLFENATDSDGDLYGRQIHSWGEAEELGPPPGFNVMHLSYRQSGLDSRIDALRTGQTIYGLTHDLPENERSLFTQWHILSYVIVPIFVDGAWWGFIGFDDRIKEREWSASEIDALRTAASAIGAVIQQDRAEKAMRASEEQYRSIFENTTDGMIITTLDTQMIAANPACCAMHGYTHDEFMHLSPRQFVAPESWQQIKEFQQTVSCGREFKAQVMALRKGGTRFDIEVRGTLITYQGKPHLLGVVRDISERMQAFRMLEQRVQERTRELSALLDVSHNVASTLELEPLLNMILDQLKLLVDYSGAAIFIKEGDSIINVEYRGPAPIDEVSKVDIQERFGVAQVLEQRSAMIIDDVRGDTPEALAFVGSAGRHMDTTFNYIRSWMGVPLMTKEWVIGVLCLDHKTPGYYTPQHARLALAIANQAAIAIENARLYEQAQQLAVLEERQRLARELHDSVSQALYGIALGARTARTQLERDPKKAVEPLNYVLSLAEAGLAEMRALIFELRPESLETEGLIAALSKQAASVRARHHVIVNTEFCEEPKLSFEIKEALYRIAQEALNNTVKHAHATTIDLRLICVDGRMTLQVQDDGAGFDPNGQFPGHLGLKSMRERIARFDGSFQVESAPGKGTCVQAQVKV